MTAEEVLSIAVSAVGDVPSLYDLGTPDTRIIGPPVLVPAVGVVSASRTDTIFDPDVEDVTVTTTVWVTPGVTANCCRCGIAVMARVMLRGAVLHPNALNVLLPVHMLDCGALSIDTVNVPPLLVRDNHVRPIYGPELVTVKVRVFPLVVDFIPVPVMDELMVPSADHDPD